ncbi:MAG: flagellar export chaperone FlgN [Melioribacter sp.]|nr:flagellar export chaperone FlgN [Melioribacter sp.]
MNVKELIQSISDQGKNFDMLINALIQKKEAIVADNYNILEDAIKNEQKILSNIDDEEKRRKELIREFAHQNSITLKDFSFDELYSSKKNLFGNDINKIERIRSEVKEKALRIAHLNSQLSVLVEVSRNIIKERMISILGSGKCKLVNKRV